MRKLAIGAAVIVGAAAPPAAERVVPVGTVADVVIAGYPARIAVAAGASGMPMLNDAAATRAGLKRGWLTLSFGVGPVWQRAPTTVTDLDFAGARIKRRVAWLPNAVAGADGEIGPAGLPESVVRFVLRPARAGERLVTMPLADGGLAGGWGVSLATMPLGKRELLIRFAPEEPESFISAGAGAAVADQFGGAVDPGATDVRVALGVRRPARWLTLAMPFRVGPAMLTRLKVRTIDFGNASGIPESGQAEGDPDEMFTVTAKARKRKYRDRLTLAADALAHCSSITFDKPARAVRLSCAAGQ